ncbi:MAG: CcdB family protein [Alphaproteobacteria bacterium]|nr:CcdB family protein [Alphaproteobacteria bacterium]
MAQFDLHLPARPMRVAYFIDLQTDFLDRLNTVVVAPLVAEEQAENSGHRTLSPRFTIEGKTYILEAVHLAAIERRMLGPKVGSLADQRYDILAALDFIFTGI